MYEHQYDPTIAAAKIERAAFLKSFFAGLFARKSTDYAKV